ncbi:conserved Plasmodium protein, unknown function [Plasmodium gallinaceum]|uniref:LEM3/CDC50 family protein n=1 Tax=Plasmodium gallinaceum TaxID=5849 RepID=A0A1J1GXL5_PLAGA|nr:conserved Plasmodium protein, unknown function [Plasmodium gallinaceum]CRG97308.1 conserved Plasmodium protein, unknown function [Plasmodium gallinaceum]
MTEDSLHEKDFSLISVNYDACEEIFKSFKRRNHIGVPIHGKVMNEECTTENNKEKNKKKKIISFEGEISNVMIIKDEMDEKLNKTDHININVPEQKRSDTLLRKKNYIFNESKYNEFMDLLKQQHLKKFNKFHYVYKWKIALIILLILSFVFLLIGFYIYYESSNVTEVNIDYELDDEFKLFRIKKDMKKPVYIYYKISNFYVNYKTFLSDESHSLLKESRCKYIKTLEDLYNYRCVNNIQTLPEINSYVDKSGKKENKKCDISSISIEEKNKRIFPCGLVAASIFNDKIDLSFKSESFHIDKFSILNHFDFLVYIKKHKDFSNYNIWINGFSPEYKNWTRSPMTSSFIKPYGVINQDLKAGHNYKIAFTQNTWPSKEWNAKKSFQLISLGVIGNSTFELAYSFFLISLIYIIIIIIMLILVKCNYCKLGKTFSYCKMSKNKNSNVIIFQKKSNVKSESGDIKQLEELNKKDSVNNIIIASNNIQKFCFCPLH